MKKSNLITLSFAASIALHAWGAGENERPNFALFMSDDCSYYDLGAYGSKVSKTPTLDKFANEGIRFTKCYESAPMCSPTRHNLYTGLWPVKSGAYPNHTRANDGVKSVVHHLTNVGYRVALIGKSHVGPNSVFPFEYVPLQKNNEINFNAVVTFIASSTKSNTPYCLFVMSNQPHTPWNKGNPELFNPETITLPPFYVDTENTRKEFCKYLAEINFMDQEFATMLNLIDKHKQTNNTVVFYLSEQGNSLPFAKWTCYDVGVHSACMVRWPGKIVPGSISSSLVEYNDVTPTIVDIAGAQPVAKMDGKSFKRVLLNPVTKHSKYAFSLQTTRGIHYGSDYYGIRSVTDGTYRYILNLTPEMEFKNAATNNFLFKEWLDIAKTDENARKITDAYRFRPATELYNIVEDPYNQHNLAGNPVYAKKVKELDKALRKWMKACGDKGQKTEMEALDHMPRYIEED